MASGSATLASTNMCVCLVRQSEDGTTGTGTSRTLTLEDLEV